MLRDQGYQSTFFVNGYPIASCNFKKRSFDFGILLQVATLKKEVLIFPGEIG